MVPEQTNNIRGMKKSAFIVLQFRASLSYFWLQSVRLALNINYSYSDDWDNGHIDSDGGDNLLAFIRELDL
jgi:hypothetical protein